MTPETAWAKAMSFEHRPNPYPIERITSKRSSDMNFLHKIGRVVFVIGIIAIYFTVLWMGLTEETRRSVTITKSAASNDDFVAINIRVTSVNPSQGLMYERVRVIPMGRFALDKATPAADLKLLVNSVSGKQVAIFPKGERISPIEITSLLLGNQNRYLRRSATGIKTRPPIRLVDRRFEATR